MKILDPGSKHLSNAEVLTHVEMLDAKYEAEKRGKKVPESLSRVIRDVKSILTISATTSTPESNAILTEPKLKSPPTLQTHIPTSEIKEEPPYKDPVLAKLATQLRDPKFKLLPAEIVQIINYLPGNTIELCMIVEEADVRYETDAVEDLVGICRAARREKEVERENKMGEGKDGDGDGDGDGDVAMSVERP